MKAIIEMENGGKMTLELYPEKAPITVANFVKLAKSGFYNGIIFHRVIAGFMIQGGDPTGTGMGGPGHNIKGEFAANGVPNDIKHVRGVISMAHADASYLDGQYAAFGKMLDGFETLDEIARVRTNFNDRPLREQKMKSVTIEE